MIITSSLLVASRHLSLQHTLFKLVEKSKKESFSINVELKPCFAAITFVKLISKKFQNFFLNQI